MGGISDLLCLSWIHFLRIKKTCFSNKPYQLFERMRINMCNLVFSLICQYYVHKVIYLYVFVLLTRWDRWLKKKMAFFTRLFCVLSFYCIFQLTEARIKSIQQKSNTICILKNYVNDTIYPGAIFICLLIPIWFGKSPDGNYCALWPNCHVN